MGAGGSPATQVTTTSITSTHASANHINLWFASHSGLSSVA